MDELFRFSVTRSADRATVSTFPLERNSKFQVNPPNPGPIGLENIATSSSRDKWADFENASLLYVLSKSTLDFINSFEWPPFLKELKQFLRSLKQAPSEKWSTMAGEFSELLQPQEGANYRDGFDTQLADLFIAFLILRSSGQSHLHDLIRSNRVSPEVAEIVISRPSLDDIADLLKLTDIIKLMLQNPSPLKTVADIDATMDASLLLPPKVFSSFEKPVHAVGITDLLVVKQHILRYELGEIARIENVLKGETRDHTQKHTLSNERDTFLQTDTETQTEQELTNKDTVNLRNEIEDTLKEDTKIDAGLHAQYTGVVNIQADLTVAYDRSSSESKKSSTEIAKDVTQRAAKKVTERIQQSTTTKVIETFEELEEQKFTNENGPNASGVYQWVEKVYLAQVFNFGKRLLFDVMVPEPAASLLAADAMPIDRRPVPPAPLGRVKVDGLGKPDLDDDGNIQLDPSKPLTPDQLTEDPLDQFGNPNFGYYGKWVAIYRALGVTPPPPASIVIARTKSFPYQDDQVIGYSEIVPIDDGYFADTANITVDWVTNNDSHFHDKDSSNNDISFISVTLGGGPQLRVGKVFGFDIKNGPLAVSSSTPGPMALAKQEHSIPLELTTVDVNELQMNIEVSCKLTTKAFAKWQLETYQAIAAAWQKLQDDYTVKVQAMKLNQQQTGILGASPDEANRQTERIELKRSCIAILSNDRAMVNGIDAVEEWNPEKDPKKPFVFADPKLSNAETEGAWVRWFEQAFDWQNMSYVFYPYFWGRASKWLNRLQRRYGTDPLFENFLRAGYARVVIPVHEGFNKAVNFYMATGRPWMGGDIPSLGDKTYLPITEEIKEATGAPGKEKPVGEPWEYRLPTTMVKLRQDDKLPPDWRWIGHDGQYDAKGNFSDPPGTWNWKGDTGG
jgi:hypothetical protein